MSRGKLLQIKRRIGATQSLKKITKAMEMVSTAQIKKVEKRLEVVREFLKETKKRSFPSPLRNRTSLCYWKW